MVGSVYLKYARKSKAQFCLTVRRARQTETKVGFNDLLVLYGKASNLRIKATLGITG